MSVWRKKAIACLPHFKKEFEHPATSIYDVFMELLPAVVEAHKNNDADLLKKIYDFAEWSFRQVTKDLWNAAGVGFYEHLGDYKKTRQEMKRWVKFDIYTQIRPLLAHRIEASLLVQIDKSYK